MHSEVEIDGEHSKALQDWGVLAILFDPGKQVGVPLGPFAQLGDRRFFSRELF